MKKIAIMGANGFVGKNVTEHLQKNYIVYPITRKEFSLLDEDAVKTFLEREKIDVIIHCANEGGTRKSGYNEKSEVVANNLRMFFNLERCLSGNMKLISFGSGAQYSKEKDLSQIKETEIGKRIPKDEYGFSKYVISKCIENKDNIYSPIIFGLFGKYEDYTFKFISNAIIKNILKMPIVINQNVVFDYLYIDDFFKVIDILIEKDIKQREFNVTPSESIDLVTIVKYINECSDYQSTIVIKNEGLNYEYTGSNAKMLKAIGEFSFTPYRDSIKELYNYYLENINYINVDDILNDKYINDCKTNK